MESSEPHKKAVSGATFGGDSKDITMCDGDVTLPGP